MATAGKAEEPKSVKKDGVRPKNDYIFHMLEERKTEMYVKFAKVMVIFQGPYTKKRTQILQQVLEKFKTASEVVSDETYCFQCRTICTFDNTDKFYNYFRARAQKVLEEGNNLVVLDPTMSNEWQNRFYLALAYKMQYVFLVCPPVVTDSSNPNWPRKSQANSFLKCRQMIESCNMFQHLFCAWYLHDMDSLELRDVAKLFIGDCLKGIPEFRNVFSRICPRTLSDDDEKDSSDMCKEPWPTIEAIRRHYRFHDERQDLAYCVVKIFQGMRDMNDYFKEEHVLKNYGKMSKLQVAGFVVSPHMVAARVKLTFNQRQLWAMKDTVNEEHFSRMKLPCASELVEQSKENLPSMENVRLISSKSNRTLIRTDEYFHEPMKVFKQYGSGRSCHIVLGKAIGAPKKNVDYDVAFALWREKSFGSDADVTELEHCVVKRLGKYWLIFLRNLYTVDGFFASCCKPDSYEKPFC